MQQFVNNHIIVLVVGLRIVDCCIFMNWCFGGGHRSSVTPAVVIEAVVERKKREGVYMVCVCTCVLYCVCVGVCVLCVYSVCGCVRVEWKAESASLRWWRWWWCWLTWKKGEGERELQRWWQWWPPVLAGGGSRDVGVILIHYFGVTIKLDV